MATAERLTVSVPSDLMDRARAAGISPSEVFQTALRERLGEAGVKSSGERIADLEGLVSSQGVKLARLEKAVRQLGRKPA